MTKLLVITVARKPLSEGSLTRNVLKWGTGAINVDGSRVAHASVSDAAHHAKEWDREYNPETNSSPIHTWDNAIGNHPGAKRVAGGGPRETDGRWPANLVLIHKSGCRRVGSKKVKGSPSSTERHEAYEGESTTGFLRGVSHPGNQHGSTDGTETVDAWECVPGCPVADLDEQSGQVRSSGLRPTTYNSSRDHTRTSFKPTQGTLYDDTGGASRFFKQVEGVRLLGSRDKQVGGEEGDEP